MTYPSFSAFAKDQISIFNELKDVDKVLRTSLFDSLVLVKNRIQQKGLNSAEASIGSYSPGYKKFRQKFGRQTDHIDETFSGDMLRDYSIIPDGPDALGVGFTSDIQADKAKANEKRFGGPIFDLSEDEQKFVEDEINKSILRIFSRVI